MVETQKRLEFVAPLLAGGDGHIRTRRDAREARDVLGGTGRFDEVGSCRGQRCGELERLVSAVLPMQVDHQVGLRPKRCPQRVHFFRHTFA